MSLGVCPSGYIELPSDKTRCRHPTGDAATVSKTCPYGFTIDVSGYCLVNKPAPFEPKCPLGYFPIPNDTSNCMTSTSNTHVIKTCPTGYTLRDNGLCWTGNTYVASGPTYCGPQYNGKICKYMRQLTTGVTPQTGTESGPNMICAFQDGDTQFPCDIGCCSSGTGTGTESTETGTESTETDLPIWVIILLIIIGCLIVIGVVMLIAKKMSRKSRNGLTASS